MPGGEEREGGGSGGLEEVKGGKSIKGMWMGFDLARRWTRKMMSGRENGDLGDIRRSSGPSRIPNHDHLTIIYHAFIK